MLNIFSLLIVLLLPFIQPTGLYAAPVNPKISATGGWSEIIDGNDLQSPWTAGSNLLDTFESITNASKLSVKAKTWWQVNVKRAGGNWHNDFTLRARKSGGPYITLTSEDHSFFCGQNNLNKINIQYELSGMSVNVPPGGYWTTVVYTIVEIGAGECN